MTIELNLIVIRTSDPKRLAEFYSLFNLEFAYHQHGNSPFHYSGHIGEILLEIYPLTKGQENPDLSLRLGFTLDDFESVIEKLRSTNVVFASGPEETEFGLMAVIIDPDGRKIELYKK
ncbi:VOC family protein [Mucilaginibacter sp. OK098]|uniref:VOC family protein n=1 Tax=Mucilaginibacter sp. OK098 TaxID=1855297 RepID=UPI00091B9FA7|nr:VOC family protein [Mucilaginibacter sp. OK098]SHM28313.1 Glyoxalase-like domain-containing protein [Mucilaginibacter sp. OK098]